MVDLRTAKPNDPQALPFSALEEVAERYPNIYTDLLVLLAQGVRRLWLVPHRAGDTDPDDRQHRADRPHAATTDQEADGSCTDDEQPSDWRSIGAARPPLERSWSRDGEE